MIYRPPLHEIILRFAESLAERSTCDRLRVGAVVTDADFMQVLGYGYNGNYAGGPNRCDDPTPGRCGCIHAELNALLKAPGLMTGKALFISRSPCVACAKAAVNARVERVFFRERYRDLSGLELLRDAGVGAFHVEPGGELLTW